MAFPETVEHLQELAVHLKKTGEPFAFLGNGSNMLVPDEGFDGWIINTLRMPSKIVRVNKTDLRVGAAVLNGRLLRRCVEFGLGGLEYLSGVPGTIGGAVVMNAGSATDFIENALVSVRSFCFQTQQEKTYTGTELSFSYRKQEFMGSLELVMEADFQLAETSGEEVRELLKAAMRRRKAAQPIEEPSCGSVFRNPKAEKAWQLIDATGLRGVSQGGAQISGKHSNFIVNKGGARMKDVLFLIKLAQEAVSHQFQIDLVPEVVLLKPSYLK